MIVSNKDSIPLQKQNVTEKKDDSLNLDFSNNKKRFIPYFKSMEEVTVEDYKLMFLDGNRAALGSSFSFPGFRVSRIMCFSACPGF